MTALIVAILVLIGACLVLASLGRALDESRRNRSRWLCLIVGATAWAWWAGLGATAQGQQRQFHAETSLRDGGEPKQNAATGWLVLKPIRAVDESLPPILADIESHLSANASLRAKYQSNMVTWAHENVHSINANAGNNAGPGLWALYCLNNRCAVLRWPRITREAVAEMVPAQLRGTNYPHYIAGGDQAMRDNPVFIILDEWVAYIAGAELSEALYGDATSHQVAADTWLPHLDAKFSMEFAGYSVVLLQAIERFEPNYPDRAKLADFVAFNMKRTQALRLNHGETIVTSYAQPYCTDGSCSPGFGSGNGWQPGTGAGPPLAPVTPPPQPKPDPNSKVFGEWAIWLKKHEAQIESAKPCACDGSGKCSCDLSKVKGCACDQKKVGDLHAYITKLEQRIVVLEKRPNSFAWAAADKDGKPAVGKDGNPIAPKVVTMGDTFLQPPLPVQIISEDGKQVLQQQHLPLNGEHTLKLKHFPRPVRGSK